MTLLESLPFAAWFKDEHGKFKRVNDAFLSTVGKERKQIIGRNDTEVFEAEEARQMEEGTREAHRTGKLMESTYSIGKRIIKTVHFPVKNELEESIGTGGYREDITNLTDSLQILHRERETLEILLETIPLCIFFTDRNQRYIRVNHMMARLLRVSGPDKAVGKTNKDFFTKRVARKMMEEDRAIIETGTPIVSKILYFEDDGVEGFWMEKIKIPIKDERGIITMTMGIFKDVSDLMRIENELKEARDRAEESDRLKTSFLANMSHEIRTPMNGIIGFANLLRDPGLTEDKRDLFLKHIDSSSGQLLNIIDDIVDISKIESGQMKISNKPVRINEVLDEIYSLFFHRIRGDAPGEKKVSFVLKKESPSNEFTIVCDDFRLSQILNNLLGNAIKFTREGHITFGYSLRNNRHVEFYVSDSGIGIPNNKIRLIFDRFGQVDQDEELQSSGTGLGLPISKSLVNLMGGEMWVESTVGKGSTFYFTLPLVIEKTKEEARVLLSNKSYNWSDKQILVAEDEELNWYFVNEMLRQTGASVHRAIDGREVVAKAKKLSPDAILMDLKMPELSGIEAARKIRGFNKRVPIIAQTAFVMAEEKEESLQAGCNHFVTKPLDRTTIMELIDSYFK